MFKNIEDLNRQVIREIKKNLSKIISKMSSGFNGLTSGFFRTFIQKRKNNCPKHSSEWTWKLQTLLWLNSKRKQKREREDNHFTVEGCGRTPEPSGHLSGDAMEPFIQWDEEGTSVLWVSLQKPTNPIKSWENHQTIPNGGNTRRESVLFETVTATENKEWWRIIDHRSLQRHGNWLQCDALNWILQQKESINGKIAEIQIKSLYY